MPPENFSAAHKSTEAEDHIFQKRSEKAPLTEPSSEANCADQKQVTTETPLCKDAVPAETLREAKAREKGDAEAARAAVEPSPGQTQAASTLSEPPISVAHSLSEPDKIVDAPVEHEITAKPDYPISPEGKLMIPGSLHDKFMTLTKQPKDNHEGDIPDLVAAAKTTSPKLHAIYAKISEERAQAKQRLMKQFHLYVEDWWTPQALQAEKSGKELPAPAILEPDELTEQLKRLRKEQKKSFERQQLLAQEGTLSLQALVVS